MNIVTVSAEELLDYGTTESDKIISINDDSLGDETWSHLSGGTLHGDKLPWNKTHEYVGLGKGEYHIWSGEDGSGKTAILLQVMQDLMNKGKRVMIVSLEMPPSVTLSIMARQAAGCFPSRDYFNQWRAKYKENGYIYSHMGEITSDLVLGVCHWASKHYKVDHIVLDSLMFLGIKRDEEPEKKFAAALVACALRYNNCIHLVAHSNKTGSDNASKWSVSGSKHITNAASKVWVVKRRKDIEEAAFLKENGQDYDESLVGLPTSSLSLEKNRQHGKTARWGFYFHEESSQFVTKEGRPYVY